MPTPTYTPLANITLTGNAGSVVFSSISQQYRDLVITAQMNLDGGNTPRILFNGDTSSSFFYAGMAGQGSTGTAPTGTQGTQSDGVSLSWYHATSFYQINVMDYTTTDKHKTISWRNGVSDGGASVEVFGARWPSNAAITSISLIAFASNFTAGSTFSLFGIAA